MLKIKWTDRITNNEVFQRTKKERLLLKIVKIRRLSSIGHIIRHNEFVVVGRPGLQYLKQVARITAADSYRAVERMACNSCRWKAATTNQKIKG